MGRIRDGLQQLQDMAAKAWEKVPKIGQGAMKAHFLAGLEELRNALYPDSNVSRATPAGVWGTRTGIEVTEDRQAPSPEELKDKASVYGRGREGPEPPAGRERMIGD
jgi:hypothetical protein